MAAANPPALQQLQQIQQQMQQMQEQMQQMEEQMQQIEEQMQQIKQNIIGIRTGLSAVEYNSIARLNNSCAKHRGWVLTPLHDLATNIDIPGFPATAGALTAMTGPQLDALLTALDLPTNGTVTARRSRVKFYIGVPDV